MSEIRGGYIKASALAGADINQYRFVAVTDADALQVDSGAIITGVSVNKPNNNQDLTYTSLGHAKIMLANSLGAGVFLMSGATGLGVQASSGQFVGGQLITGADSGSPGEMIVAPFRTLDQMG